MTLRSHVTSCSQNQNRHLEIPNPVTEAKIFQTVVLLDDHLLMIIKPGLHLTIVSGITSAKKNPMLSLNYYHANMTWHDWDQHVYGRSSKQTYYDNPSTSVVLNLMMVSKWCWPRRQRQKLSSLTPIADDLSRSRVGCVLCSEDMRSSCSRAVSKTRNSVWMERLVTLISFEGRYAFRGLVHQYVPKNRLWS